MNLKWEIYSFYHILLYSFYKIQKDDRVLETQKDFSSLCLLQNINIVVDIVL